MAAVKELLRTENDGTLSFGDYTLASKTKKDNCEFAGDIYKVKTLKNMNLKKTEDGLLSKRKMLHIVYKTKYKGIIILIC